MPDVISYSGNSPFRTSLAFSEINLKIFLLTTRKYLIWDYSNSGDQGLNCALFSVLRDFIIAKIYR